MTSRPKSETNTAEKPKRIRYRLVAEGNDVIEAWCGDFEVLETVGQILMEAEEIDGAIDWRVVLADVPGLSSEAAEATSLEIDSDLDLLRLVDGVDVDARSWGGDTPGLSGCWVKVRVRSDRYRRVVETVRTLVARLEEHWERTGSRSRNVAAATEKATQHLQAVLDAEDEVERLQLAMLDAELSRTDALASWCRQVLSEPALQPSAYEWILIARNTVFFLEKGIFREPYPGDESHREAVEQLRRERHRIVRVCEALPAHMGPPTGLGRALAPRGWKQIQTLLSAASDSDAALAVQARAEYVARLKQHAASRE